MWTNESLNIWTHLIGGIWFLMVIIYDNYIYIPEIRGGFQDHLIVTIFDFCFAVSIIKTLVTLTSAKQIILTWKLKLWHWDDKGSNPDLPEPWHLGRAKGGPILMLHRTIYLCPSCQVSSQGTPNSDNTRRDNTPSSVVPSIEPRKARFWHYS